MNNKLIVILGPTASGKSDLAVKLAKKYHGEIVSADSRQVYRGLDIGSGKITKKEMMGIPHHLLDVANPKRRFSVAQYQQQATKAIKAIQKKGKIPFLVGGTGFYIQSIVDGIALPEVPPNPKLRTRLAKLSTEKLFAMLEKLDPERATAIDAKNPHRLIRAIEIVKGSGKPVPALQSHGQFEILQLGVSKPKEELHKAIQKRLAKRLKQGMITEVKTLHAKGLSWKRLEELGLEYRYIAQYLQGKITLIEMQTMLQKEIEQFAKRQMTWFKRDKKIHWITHLSQAQNLIKAFLQ